MASTSDSAAGITAAAPTPCPIRPAISIVPPVASAQNADAAR